jgi:hypothetical protein
MQRFGVGQAFDFIKARRAAVAWWVADDAAAALANILGIVAEHLGHLSCLRFCLLLAEDVGDGYGRLKVQAQQDKGNSHDVQPVW